MRRFALLLLAAGTLAACGDFDVTEADGPLGPEVAAARHDASGPYEVGFTTFMVYRGDRAVPVYVWYPADPDQIDGSSPEAMYPLDPFVDGAPIAPSSAFEAHGLDRAYQEPAPAEGPFPLVMYSPGWMGSAYTDGFYIGTGLARHGFVVAATTHWGDQVTLNPDEPLDHLALALFNRPRDVSAALDVMLARNAEPGDLLHGLMIPDGIVATGWSIGGYAAMALVGGDDEVCDLADVFPGWPVPPETCAPTYPDPRIERIIPLDGSNQVLHFSELARVDVPVLGIGEEWAMVGYWQARQHAAFTGHPAYRVDVLNTAHISFSTSCAAWSVMDEYGALPVGVAEEWQAMMCMDGTLAKPEAHRIVLKYMLAFLNHDQRVLTPGHALTSEPNVEFFVTEKRSARSIDAEWPGRYTYFMHQPGSAHAMAYESLEAQAEMDPTGPRPLDFAALAAGARGH